MLILFNHKHKTFPVTANMLLKWKDGPLCQEKFEEKPRRPIARKIGHRPTYFNLKNDNTEGVFNTTLLGFLFLLVEFFLPLRKRNS